MNGYIYVYTAMCYAHIWLCQSGASVKEVLYTLYIPCYVTCLFSGEIPYWEILMMM